MLSHEDERRLAAIERQLMSDDPTLARHPRTLRSRWGRILAVVVGVLCALATAAAPTVAAGWFLCRGRWSRR